MRFSKYITRIWFFANVIHPIIYWIYFLVPLWVENILTMLSYWFFCYVFSLPAFLIGCVVFPVVKKSFFPRIVKLFVLMLTAIAGIIVSVMLLSFVIPGNHFRFLLKQSIPAMISIVLTMIICYSSFIESINSEDHEVYSFL